MGRARDERLRRAYSLSGPDEAVSLYRDWAEVYDRDTVRELGYVAPQVTVNRFCRHFSDTEALLLDAGCGTGLAGIELRDRGFTRVDGLDISPEMLEKARQKGVYERLLEADLTRPLAVDADTYHAVVSVGTFTHGHVGTEGLAELIRITRPGGIICFSINEGVFGRQGFEAAFRRLAERGAASLVECVEAEYIRHEGIGAYVATLRVEQGG